MSEEKAKDKPCDYNSFKRARYFHGMLMSERDFNEEQIYHNEKRKLLNRMLHGWGVVCGLKMEPTIPPGPGIGITPGLALDSAGNEIFVGNSYTLDVQEYLQSLTTGKQLQTQAEECAQKEKQQGQPQENDKWYVVIRYAEVPTDPVPVYAPGGGCEEKRCDYSRTREGYCIELTKTIPRQSQKQDKEKMVRHCPIESCDDPLVVLGSITIGKDITLLEINEEMISNSDQRRFVLTFDMLHGYMAHAYPGKTFIDLIIDFFSHMMGK
jgi:hypothetical protein